MVLIVSSNTAIGIDSFLQLHSGTNNTAIGRESGDNPGVGRITANNSTYVGANTSISANGVTNETVIGEGATGKGDNTIQIGNCDVSDVYLGCDGSGTTLHVDNIILCDLSACNADISQNLTVDGSANFTTGRIDFPRVFDTGPNAISGNLFLGRDAGNNFGISDVGENTGLGRDAMKNSTPNAINCDANTAVGERSGQNISSGGVSCNFNTCIGATSLAQLNSGSNNVGIGRVSGNHSGALDLNNSTYLGANTNVSASGVTNETVIGEGATGKGSNTIQIGNNNVNDVYISGDLTGTTLYVDNIVCHSIDGSGGDTHTVCDLSVCNVDVSQNLAVDASVNFTTGRIDFPRVFDTSNSLTDGNLFLGMRAGNLFSNGSAGNNTALGRNAMLSSLSGSHCQQNTAVGDRAGQIFGDVDGSDCLSNTAIGTDSFLLLHSGTDNTAIGKESGRNTVGRATLNNSTYLGANTSLSSNEVTNETVIGQGATGKGDNTVQIGNCDVSDVYLGCDGSGTTLHVDNIILCDLSACNADISQNLTVDGSANFTTGRIDFPRVFDTNTTLGGNLFLGHLSGNNFSINSSGFNTSLGRNTMTNSIPGNCQGNTVVGDGAGSDFGFLGDCSNNTAIGHETMPTLDLGGNNSAFGYLAGWNAGVAPTTLNNSTYLGAETKNSADGVTNETVIGHDATGKGSNTVQIGNCDVTDVYLGCDGSGTTLHVDNVDVCGNVDISGILTVSGENVHSALFTSSEIAEKTIISTGNSSGAGNIGAIMIDDIVNNGVIFLETSGSNTDFIWHLESKAGTFGDTIENSRKKFQNSDSTLLLKFGLVNSDPSANITLKFNYYTELGDIDGNIPQAKGGAASGGNTPSIIRWNGNPTVSDSKSMIGGLELSWNGNAWTIINAFNFTEIKDGNDSIILISG